MECKMSKLLAIYTIAKARVTGDVKSFLEDASGVTAIEYGLIAALVAVAIITAVTTLGTNLSDTFNTIAGKL
jgi:pilus assembly protein Flp/PilA